MRRPRALTAVNADRAWPADAAFMGNCRNLTRGGVSIDAKLAVITHDLQACGQGAEALREASIAWVLLTRLHMRTAVQEMS